MPFAARPVPAHRMAQLCDKGCVFTQKMREATCANQPPPPKPPKMGFGEVRVHISHAVHLRTLRMLLSCERALRLCTAATFSFRVFTFRNVSRDASGRGMHPLPSPMPPIRLALKLPRPTPTRLHCMQWGAPLWTALEMYAQLYPFTADAAKQAEAEAFFRPKGILSSSIPCGKCKHHFDEYTTATPAAVGGASVDSHHAT